MKGFSLGVLFAFISFSILAQQTVKEREEIASKGIKKRIEFRLMWENNNWSLDTIAYKFHTYDDDGNHIINGTYDDNGHELQIYLRTYDSLNFPIQRKYFCDRSDEKPEGNVCLFFTDYEFDYWGNVTREVGYGEDSTFFVKVLFRRDSGGNPIERWDIFKDLTRNKYYRYTNDQSGIQNSMEIFDYLNQRISFVRTTNTYDLSGRKTEMRQTNELGDLVGREEFEYDHKGDLRVIIQHNGKNEPIRKRIFIYEFY